MEKVQFVIINKAKILLIIPPIYSMGVSVSGNLKDFIIVGKAANPSLTIANRIEIPNLFVII